MEQPIWALGLMSGTSMDGIDAAALLTDGEEVFGFGPKRFVPFDKEQTAVLRSGLGKWQSDDGLDAIAAQVLETHVEAVRYFPTTELVGFHGQTLSHDPQAYRTFQIGDGAALAAASGKTVVWDFRTADVLSGGEGAPLVPVFHFACAKTVGLSGVTAILNIGGVANVTWLDPNCARAESPGALLAFDTGPGNALINDYLNTHRGLAMDENGSIAETGVVRDEVVTRALDHPYFRKNAPKSLDRNDFSDFLQMVSDLSVPDAVATLTAITAASIAASVRHMPEPPERWLVAGGGRHNKTLMRMLQAHSNIPVEPVEAVNLDGDMLEAQAFAYLAVRVKRGLATSLPSTTGARLPVSGGRISEAAPRVDD